MFELIGRTKKSGDNLIVELNIKGIAPICLSGGAELSKEEVKNKIEAYLKASGVPLEQKIKELRDEMLKDRHGIPAKEWTKEDKEKAIRERLLIFENRDELNIFVPGGIGDVSWIYSKLVNLNKPINWLVQDEWYTRAKPFLNLLPLTKSVFYQKMPYVGMSSMSFWDNNIEKDPCHLQANIHLEEGKRLETYLPRLTTEFHYKMNIPDEHKKNIDDKLGDWKDEENLVGIYTSSYYSLNILKISYVWTPKDWFEFVLLYYRLYPQSKFVLIGGGTIDGEYVKDLAELLKKENVPFKNLCGTKMGECVYLLKKLKQMVGFPSGVTILSTVVNTPVFILYWAQIEKIINSWPPPEMIRNGTYKGYVFCKPEQAIELIEIGGTPWK